MHNGHKPELEEVMTKAFEEVVGKPISVKVDELTLDQRREELAHLQEAGLSSEEGEVMSDLDKLVFGSSPYDAHDKRLDEWWSYKSVSRKITV